MKRVGLKWKIFMYLLLFCSMLLVVLWLFQTIFLDEFYKITKVNEVKKSATKIVQAIGEAELEDIVDNVALQEESYIEVLDSEGNTIFASGDMKNRLSLVTKNRMLSNLTDGEYIEYYDNHLNSNNTFMDGPKPFQSIVYLKQSTNNHIVLINSMISPVSATVDTLRYQLYYVTAIMILFAIVFAIIISSLVSRPIEKLNEKAKKLAKGNYEMNFAEEGYKEINELGQTLTVAASELNKVESLRRELLANISHDLRTPLSLIYGYAELMHDFPEDISPEQTQTIMDEVDRLTTLVNDVLDISQLEAGVQKLNSYPFNLTSSLKETTDRLEKLVSKNGYTIQFEANQVVKYDGDEVKITQAFYNLLINAVNYTGDDKRVLVRQLVSDHEIRIEVIDSGEGIEEKDLASIWNRYYKVDKIHKRPITGTGLGLSIVKRIIDMHDGNYGVESEVGKGSTFWFSLKK